MASLFRWMMKKVGMTGDPESLNIKKEDGVKDSKDHEVDPEVDKGKVKKSKAEEYEELREKELEYKILKEEVEKAKLDMSRKYQDKADHRQQNNIYDQIGSKARVHIGTYFKSLDPLFVAKQLHKIEMNEFKQIGKEDLIFAGSNKSWSTNIRKLIENFEQIYYWIIETVLTEKDQKKRSKLISSFIRMAECFHYNRNLNACKAVVSALETNEIARLDKTWKKVSSWDKELLNAFSALYSEEWNHEKLTYKMKKWFDSNSYCIPWFALTLKDYEVWMKPVPDIRIMSVGRINIIEGTLKKIQSQNYVRYDISTSFERFWASIKYSEQQKEYLKKAAYNLSHELEPAKKSYRSYKL